MDLAGDGTTLSFSNSWLGRKTVKHRMTPAVALLAFAFTLTPLGAQEEDFQGIHWPQFRGPQARGIAEGFKTPTDWNVPAGENVRWKTALPGLAHSSPVIWGDRIFVTTVISGMRDPELKVGLYGNITPVQDDTEHVWKVISLDKKTGQILWERTAHKGVPKIKRHTKATHANSTPATDGKKVVAFFGSEGLYCYDMEGNLLWKKDLGVLDSGFFMVPTAQWGFGSSPVIHNGVIYIQADVQKDSFLAAFDLDTGNELWRTARDDVPTWSSPTVFESRGRLLIAANGYKHIGGYDAKTGQEIWRMRGGGDIPIPTPQVAQGLIFITNAHGRMSPIYAIRPDARGDISLQGDASSNQSVVWSVPRQGAYMPTPLVYGETLYLLRDRGVLASYKAASGEQIIEQTRLGGSAYSASGVAADGKLYYTSEEGDVYVVRHGPEFDLLATNPLGEICMATPAISEGVIYFRTKGHLIAVGE